MEAQSDGRVVDWRNLHESKLLTPDTICEVWDRVSSDLMVWNQCGSEDPGGEGGTRRLVSFDAALCDRIVLQPLIKFLHRDQSASTQGVTVCGRVFNAGDPTYNCRHCSLDPTCVLCSSCFRQSAHVHHRYVMALSMGSGGYCDCGDVEAWKAEPHCSQHRPSALSPPSTDEASCEPPGEEEAVDRMFFAALLKFMVLAFESAESDSQSSRHRETEVPPTHSHVLTLYNISPDMLSERVADFVSSSTGCELEDAKRAVLSLRSIGLMPVYCGDLAFCRRMLCRMSPSGSFSSALLSQLERRVVSCSTLARHQLVMLMMPFFRELLEREPGRRPAFGGALRDLSSGGTCCLRRLITLDSHIWKAARQECQLLFIHGLLMEPSSRLHFAEVFIECYSSVVEASTRHSGTIHDLSVQALTVPSVAHHLIANCDALAVVLSPLINECVEHLVDGTVSVSGQLSNSAPQRQLLNQFSCIHDMQYMMNSPPVRWNPQLTAGFKSAVSSFIQLLSIFEGMSPMSRITTEHVLYEPSCELEMTVLSSLVPVTRLFVSWCVTDLALLIDTYRLVAEKLRTLPEPRGFALHRAQLFDVEVEVARCRTAEVPVSLILPLSRFLVTLRLSAETVDISDEEKRQMLDSGLDPRLLMESSLRALVFNEQVFSGQWRRNGQTVEILCNWYSHMTLCNDLRDKDLQILQMCAAALDSDVFVSSLMFRFGIDAYISQPQNVTESDADMQSGVAHFLLVLIYVLSERYHVSVGQVTPFQCLRKEVIQWLSMSAMSRSKLLKLLGDVDESMVEVALSEVADSSHPENSHLMYKLKPACYGDYSALWMHYSRRAQSAAEQNMRKLSGDGEGVLGLASSLPCFRSWLRPLTGLMTGRVILSLLNSILDRLISGKAGSQNGCVVFRLLYLVAMAILSDRERETSVHCSALSCFCTAAEKSGLTRRLQTLAGGGSFCEFASLFGWLLERLQRRVPPPPSVNCSEREQQRKRVAAARKLSIMRQMATQQRRFLARQPVSSSGHDPGPETRVPDARVREDTEEGRAGVCLGSRQSVSRLPIGLDSSGELCILCQSRCSLEPGGAGTALFRLVVCALVQESRHLAPALMHAPSGSCWGQPGSAALWRLPHASSCGHVMHAVCWLQYLRVVTRERRRTVRPMGVFGADWRRGEYLCPLCQRLSNTVLPLLQSSPVQNTSQLRPLAETEDTSQGFEPWLHALQEEAGGVSGSAAKTGTPRAPTSEDGREVPPDRLFQLSSLDCVMMNRFCGTCRTVDGLKGLSGGEASSGRASRSDVDFELQSVLAVEADVDVSGGSGMEELDSVSAEAGKDGEDGVMALLCCAYTIRCLERQLRADEAPLMSAEDLRTTACLSTLIRLVTCLGAQKAVHAESHSHLQLLAGESPRPSAAADPPAALKQDAFCALVRAVPAFVTLIPSEHTDQVDALPPTGSTQEQHALQLCLVLCITQAFLSYEPPVGCEQSAVSGQNATHSPPTEHSAQSDDVMEWAESGLGWPISEKDRDWILQLGQLARAAARLPPISNYSQQTSRHVVSLVLPFLRCCAVLFRYISGVAPPLSLLEPCPDPRRQMDHLLLYLGVELTSVPLQSVKQLVTRWCGQIGHDATDEQAGRGTVSSPGFVDSTWRRVFVSADRCPVLVSLPREFSELVVQASAWQCGCDQCLGPFSRSPTLCLLCGFTLCSETLCSSASSQRRGMDGHTLICGGTAAAFLVVRRCKLYLTYSTSGSFRRALYPSPYVDQYGECDEGLRRGVPLSLHALRYKRLQQLVFSHGVVEQVCRYVEEHSARIPLLT